MKDQIDAILSGVKDKAVNKVGPYWQIRVGTRAGARENGVSLARELLKQYSEDVAPPAAPVTDYEAIIADLKVQLAAKPAFEAHAVPAPVQMPTFLAEDKMEIDDDFVAAEAQPGEDRSATINRLQLELEVLVNRSFGGPLPDADQARMSELTTNLRLGG